MLRTWCIRTGSHSQCRRRVYRPAPRLDFSVPWFLTIKHITIEGQQTTTRNIDITARINIHESSRHILGVPHPVSHPRHERLRLLHAPAQNLADGEDDEAVQAHVHVGVDEAADGLELPVPGPRAHGDFKRLLLDVDEAGVGGVLLDAAVGEFEGAADPCAYVVEELGPLLEDAAELIQFSSGIRILLSLRRSEVVH
jgi:hypothetical protein